MALYLLLLLLAYLLRLWISGFGGVHPDEAYYWTWAQTPQWGYFDHPPMVAWLIGAGEALLNSLLPDVLRSQAPDFWAQIAMRWLPYLVSSVLTPLLLGRCIELVQRQPLRTLQIFVLGTAPIFIFGPQVITPDTPFFAAWSLCLYFVLHILRSRPATSYPGDVTPFRARLALGLGLSLALAAYSKYSAFLLAFLVLLGGAGLYNGLFAGGVAALLLLPHALWTHFVARPEGAGVFFQAINGMGAWSPQPHYHRVADLWLAQVALWTPLVFLSVFLLPLLDLKRFFVSDHKNPLSRTLCYWALAPLLFFSTTGLRRPPEANWPLVGALAALILANARLRKRDSWLWLCIIGNAGVSLLLLMIFTQGPLLAQWLDPHFPRAREQLQRPSRLREFRGWDRLHTLVLQSVERDTQPLEVQSYQLLSELLYYDKVAGSPLGPRLRIWSEGSRRSHFNMRSERLPERPAASRWLLVQVQNDIPKDCRLQQSFFRIPEDTTTYTIYRCGPDTF